MGEQTQVKQPAQWLRVWDLARVDSELGPLFEAEREAVITEFQAGAAQAFHAVSDAYDVWMLLRFEARDHDGALQCHIVAIKGEGIDAGRSQLAALAKQAGATALTCDAYKVGVIRLHSRAGWEVENCRMRLEL